MASIETGASFDETGSELCLANRNLADQFPRPKLTLVPGTREAALIGARELLISTLGESSQWYNDVATDLNEHRDIDQQIPVVPENELPDRATAWLTNDRLRAAQPGNGLHRTADSPLVVLALPNRPISREETVRSWANARNGKLLEWGGRLAFLRHWSPDELSGYDPYQAHEPVRFVVIETAYHRERRGFRENQLYELGRDQAKQSLIGPATVFEGAILAKGCSDVSLDTWEKTVVRAIGLRPNRDDCVPLAFLNHNGEAVVSEAGYGYSHVSRRRIG